MTKRHNIAAPTNSVNSTQERRARNKAAFVAVLGDPTGVPEAIDGMYNTLKSRSSISAMDTNFDMGTGSRNPAQPSVLDFFIDVENAIATIITDEKDLKIFWEYYRMGDTEKLTGPQRSKLEQRIGRLFIAQKIWPVNRYFTSIRRGINEKRKEPLGTHHRRSQSVTS